eukprot:s994_g7.t1
MSKSPEAARKVFDARAADSVHLLLCDALFQFQLWRSPQSHAHLEQPQGSQMVYQEELQAILDQAYVAYCDMCRVGHLKHPVSGKLIQKGTQIITTSEIMYRYLDQQKCDKSHDHDTIAGSFRHPTLGRINVSQYTELYTRQFASKIVKCFQCISQVREMSPVIEQAMVQHSLEEATFPHAKRQKINGKQTPPHAYSDATVQQAYDQFLQNMMRQAPRVGKRSFTSGEIVEQANQLFPKMHIRGLEVCKGADRCRVPFDGITRKNATHRFTMGIHRHQVGHFADEVWENWTTLTRKQLTRKSQPARLLVTLFGNPKNENGSPILSEPPKQAAPDRQQPEPVEEPVAKRFRTSDPIQPSLEPDNAPAAEEPKCSAPDDSHRWTVPEKPTMGLSF